MQLQSTHNDLQTWMLDTPDNVANVASQAVLAVAQTFLTNVLTQTGGQPLRNTRVADPESFYGYQEKTMQIVTFVDKRMKILYALSFMCRGMAQIWATNC